jgi:hypothetical protein
MKGTAVHYDFSIKDYEKITSNIETSSGTDTETSIKKSVFSGLETCTLLQTILEKGVFKTDESVGEILEIAIVDPVTSTKIEIEG